MRPIELISPLVSQRSRSLPGKCGCVKELLWAFARGQIRTTRQIGAIAPSCARVCVTGVYVIQYCERQSGAPNYHHIEYPPAFQRLLNFVTICTERERVRILAGYMMTYIESAIAIIKRTRLTKNGSIAAARHIAARR